MKIVFEELGDRFWSKVEKTAACWLWRRSVDNSGYGQFSVVRERNGKMRHVPVKAHLAYWGALRGEVPGDMMLRHTCGNRACVRLEHLELTPYWRITEAAVQARQNAAESLDAARERFVEKIEKQPNGCWLWFGARVVYGKFWIGGRELGAHRAALVLFKDVPLDKIDLIECVLHECDVPRCVNPKHLRAGTFKENSADMLAKGRHRVGTMKLNAAEAACVRAEYVPRYGELKRLAEKYGVTKSCIFDIVNGTRKDVAYTPLTTAPTGELPLDTRARGSRHALAKMTEEQVREMRHAHSLGEAIPLLAQKYDISRRTAWEIIVGKTWKHVT